MHSVPALFHDIVDQDAAAAAHVTDDVHDLGHAGFFAPLVDDGEVGFQPFRELPRPQHAADIGRDHHDRASIAIQLVLDVAHEDGCGIEVVDRDIEEALDLPGMQVDRQHPGQHPPW